MSKTIKASDVFTPTKPPVDKHNIYIHRVKFESKFKRAFERGATPVIFGDYGVGKTSLSLISLDNLMGEDGLVIRMTDPDNKDISAVYKLAFEKLEYEVTVSETSGSGRNYSAEIQASANSSIGIGKLFEILKVGVSASGKAEKSESETREKQFLVSSPTESKAIEVFSENKVVFLIDELHRASDALKSQIAAAIKSCSDQGLEFPKFILCGTSSDAGKIAEINQGVDRLINEIKVPPLTREESEKIVVNGFDVLGVNYEKELPERVAGVAGGAPSLVHSIALELAESALSTNQVIDADHLREALSEVIEQGQNERMLQAYNRAINHKGSKRYRKHILTVMASSDETYVTTGELAEGVSKILREEVPQTVISGPLRDLKSERYGSILSNPLMVDGREQQNQSCFSQPQMKSYIRFLLKVSDSGVDVTRDGVAG